MALITEVKCSRIPAFSGDLRNGGTNSTDATHFANNGKTLVIIYNHAGGGYTEDIEGVPDKDGRDTTVSNSTTDAKFYICGPFPVEVFNSRDADTYPGYVEVTASASAAVDWTTINYAEAYDI